jgi:flagellar biogenesis protein FliO
VDIVLEADDLVIDSTSITVNTSIINTLAIILLACLAFIVALAILVRRLLRKYRGGKHSRGKVNT